MKKILFLIFMLNGFYGRAQGLSNLFSQQAADIKYVLAQIALLQVYIGYVEKGYEIAHDGLTLIGEIKRGDLDMHSLYFNSLKAVNPSVAGYSKIAAILSMDQSIVAAFKELSLDDPYIRAVHDHLMNECSENMAELVAVTSDGLLEMTDDERIKRIDLIYTDMKDKMAFAQYFAANASLLAGQKVFEKNVINSLKKME